MRCAALRLREPSRNVDMFWSGKKNAEHFLRARKDYYYLSLQLDLHEHLYGPLARVSAAHARLRLLGGRRR